MDKNSKIITEKRRIKQMGKDYALGFHMPSKYAYISQKGLNEDVIKAISQYKDEPSWMLKHRLRAFEIFKKKHMPEWGASLSALNFDNFHYYIKPEGEQSRTWDDVPKDIKETFDKIGIPEAERAHLAGVKSQYDSEVMYGSIQEELEKQGVLFLSYDEALKEHPEIIKQYFGTIIPPEDNKFAALNTAVWSGGSFVYVPKGVEVKLPLQAYFRINSPDAGQFERTLIVVEEGGKAHYTEGCFPKGGALITTNCDYKNIEDIKAGERVLTHKGTYKPVYHTQKRSYTGQLYTIKVWGDSALTMNVTKEHPLMVAKRQFRNERNREWRSIWAKPDEIRKHDYLMVPINKNVKSSKTKTFKVKVGNGKHDYKNNKIKVNTTPDLFRLIGYYMAKGSTENRGYLKFSFGSTEQQYINDVKKIIKTHFGIDKSYEFIYKDRNGVELVFSSVILARIFQQFGTHNYNKSLPQWVMGESPAKQKELLVGIFRGDGNYFDADYKNQKGLTKPGRKELFRINTTSFVLVRQLRDILLRLGIVSFINARDRSKENRRTIYTLGISGENMIQFGKLVGVNIDKVMNGKKRANRFFIDKNYAYLPIKVISSKSVKNLTVYNFGVEDNETYVANSVAVHNCSAPAYSSGSLHSAVVEIVAKKGSKVQYTTIQNWYKNVYNLVTKRAAVHEEAQMSWVDANLGSRVTMKYPSVFLMGRKAYGEILSIAFAGEGQHQDAGGKAIHLAPETTSKITSKSISKDGGRSSYRGMLSVAPNAYGCKSKVVCDALILDSKSRTDTYPTMDIKNSNVSIEHEATVSKVSAAQLFYLMSRGLDEETASGLIVNGFIDPVVKELPMEYAVELNRLIQLEMAGSVG